MKNRPDFVQVSLSDAGVAFAGEGGSLRLATGAMAYTFNGKQPVEVLTSEWRQLRRDCDAAGKPLFEEFQIPAVAVTGAAKGEVSSNG